MPNRLSNEKSPYLLQHRSNPVDWFPWGEEALKKARTEDKPIFLSIGYSTCHWCHVMEKESFENEDVADLLNQSFVSIKVDREERPDLDQIYMNAVQVMTGSGGWPLTVFLTPEGKPFSGGTYFPPEDRMGRAGMKTILPRIAELWKIKRKELVQAGNEMTEMLQPHSPAPDSKALDESILSRAYEQLAAHYDPVNGGFGGAPKFPRSHELSFLLRWWKRSGDKRALDMVRQTLIMMRLGGIYDHLGGGFSRYSTDENWLVPHFEKMLYDQAILARTYLEMVQITHDSFFEAAVREIFRYVLRDLHDPSGGFYCAEDADSEGEEGKFYVWTPQEIHKVLGDADAKTFMDFYGVTEGGNFEHNTSILHQKKIDASLFESLEKSRQKLFAVREKRIRPHRDDKIITSWNGLMITAFALGGRVLGDPDLTEAAVKAARFIETRLLKGGQLLRRFREGHAGIEGYHDDYAYFVWALMELYESTLDAHWLDLAKRMVERMIAFFWDDQDKGFFYVSRESERLIAEHKEFYDGAMPSSNSIAAWVLLRLGRLLGIADWENKGEEVLRSNQEAMHKYPQGFTFACMVLDYWIGPSQELLLLGDLKQDEIRSLIRSRQQNFHPHLSIAVLPKASDKNRGLFSGKVPSKHDGEAAAILCENQVCHPPIKDLDELVAKLDRVSK